MHKCNNSSQSRAMNLLRSPCLEITTPSKQRTPTKTGTWIVVPTSAFTFITCKLLGKLIWRAKRGTAVDQWGWDSREMWQDILTDAEFLGHSRQTSDLTCCCLLSPNAAPIIANSLGQYCANTVQFLRNLVNHQAKILFGFTIDFPAYTTSQFSPPSTQQKNDNIRLQGLKYHENCLRLSTCVF